MEIVAFIAFLLFLYNIIQLQSLSTCIIFLLWILPPMMLTLILRNKMSNLLRFQRKPKNIEPLELFDIFLVIPLLCIFGWISAVIIIHRYQVAREKEKQNTPWWRLREYGGKF